MKEDFLLQCCLAGFVELFLIKGSELELTIIFYKKNLVHLGENLHHPDTFECIFAKSLQVEIFHATF
jgi:hypothetical protein